MKALFLCPGIILFLLLIAWGQPASDTSERGLESQKANGFFDKCFDETVARSPISQSYLGIKTDYDKWDDESDARTTEDLAVTVRQLEELQRTIRFDLLDEKAKFSYRLFQTQAEEAIEGFRWRYHDYPVNQMFGFQSEIPSFLINIHTINNAKEAEDYIARLQGVTKLMDQSIDGLKIRQQKGVLPPKFVFGKVIESCRNILVGRPFDDSKDDSPLLADFRKKVTALKDLPPTTSAKLLADAETALRDSLAPAYRKLITVLEEQDRATTASQGVWHLPDGDAYYRFQLRHATTTDLTSEQIHAIGLSEVARIRGDMTVIMKKVEFKGKDLQDFFRFLRDDPQFYYPNTLEGKTAYLAGAVKIIDTMRGRLDELFLTKPKAPIIVKAVEPFREKSAGGAFYQDPAPDGSRPGIYYANLYNMKEMPKYEMEALAYHEGIPGHHMQLAIAQELENMPKFRKFNSSYTAYVEGWGLYCEWIPSQMGFYADPYSDFGRLSMEMTRACRLVVDTGIHSMKWTRQQAIDFMLANSPASESDVAREVERYFVMPGQATAYKMGMLKIQQLRIKAETVLGQRFDIREFHDVILKNGAVPLSVLEELVDGYIAKRQAQAEAR